MIFEVYLPTVLTAQSLALPARGSGIVGMPREYPSDPLLLYYEGNIYGADNIITFADRCHHAAGRLKQNYPTVARYSPADEDVLYIGIFDDEAVRVTLDGLGSVEALCSWLGEQGTHVDPRELERGEPSWTRG